MNHRRITIISILLLLTSALAYSQCLNFSEEEQKVYEVHKEEIKMPVEYLAADVFSDIQETYIVNPYKVKTLRRLCERMETHKYLHNFILETSRDRYLKKREIETIYWDSISAVLLNDNPQMAGKYIGYALKMVKELNLDCNTEDYLKRYSIQQSKRIKDTPCSDYSIEEMDTLKSILEKYQIERIVNIINEPKANEKSRTLWSALSANGLTDEMDEMSDTYKVYAYYLNEMFIYDYYSGNSNQLEANLEDLHRKKPSIIRIFEGLEKKENIIKKREKKNGIEYVW